MSKRGLYVSYKNGKTRKIEEIEGPITFSIHTLGNRKFYIFGEAHDTYTSCKYELKTNKLEDLLIEFILKSNEQLDVFIEYDKEVIIKTNKQTNEFDYTSPLTRFTYKARKLESLKRNKKLKKNIRIQYTDFRFQGNKRGEIINGLMYLDTSKNRIKKNIEYIIKLYKWYTTYMYNSKHKEYDYKKIAIFFTIYYYGKHFYNYYEDLEKYKEGFYDTCDELFDFYPPKEKNKNGNNSIRINRILKQIGKESNMSTEQNYYFLYDFMYNMYSNPIKQSDDKEKIDMFESILDNILKNKKSKTQNSLYGIYEEFVKDEPHNEKIIKQIIKNGRKNHFYTFLFDLVWIFAFTMDLYTILRMFKYKDQKNIIMLHGDIHSENYRSFIEEYKRFVTGDYNQKYIYFGPRDCIKLDKMPYHLLDLKLD